MSEVKHTPGPWRFIPRDETPGHREPDMVQIGAATWLPSRGRDENADANARLIAAAPEILLALKRCEAMVGTDQGPPNWDWVREVISKAEGRLP